MTPVRVDAPEATGTPGPRIEESAGTGDVAERLRLRRRGMLRPIDRMLLHSPPLADGWNSFLGALRQGLTLRGEIRELVILRIAVLNDAPYEWDSHVAVARREGLKDAALRALRSLHPESSPALSPVQKRVLALTDSMTRVVQVPDATFDPLRSDFTATELVELVATIAAYNMVSRFAVALNINERGEQS